MTPSYINIFISVSANFSTFQWKYVLSLSAEFYSGCRSKEYQMAEQTKDCVRKQNINVLNQHVSHKKDVIQRHFLNRKKTDLHSESASS